MWPRRCQPPSARRSLGRGMSAADCMAMDCQLSLTKTIAFAQFDMSLSVSADARIGHASAARFLCAALAAAAPCGGGVASRLGRGERLQRARPCVLSPVDPPRLRHHVPLLALSNGSLSDSCLRLAGDSDRADAGRRPVGRLRVLVSPGS